MILFINSFGNSSEIFDNYLQAKLKNFFKEKYFWGGILLSPKRKNGLVNFFATLHEKFELQISGKNYFWKRSDIFSEAFYLKMSSYERKKLENEFISSFQKILWRDELLGTFQENWLIRWLIDQSR